MASHQQEIQVIKEEEQGKTCDCYVRMLNLQDINKDDCRSSDYQWAGFQAYTKIIKLFCIVDYTVDMLRTVDSAVDVICFGKQDQGHNCDNTQEYIDYIYNTERKFVTDLWNALMQSKVAIEEEDRTKWRSNK